MRTTAPWLLALLAACHTAPRPDDALRRCIWVDRWDYRTAADIDTIMADCQAAGFTAVMFQVRGNGTVGFPSKLELWSERFGFQDPGFDPLQTAVAAAHRRSLQLHAWVNVMPGWSGDQPPSDPRQLLRARPDWFLHRRDGRGQQPKPGKYLTLNPCLPEVRSYLANLCREIVTRYQVDGLQLDYIRFPDAEGDDVDQLGTDARTMSLFTGTTGRASSDLTQLRLWQTQCVTALVAEIRRAVRAVDGRSVALTAAVFADPDVARERVRQDWGAWLQRGLVDAVLPMNYTADDQRFAELVRRDVELAQGRPVITGIGTWQHRDADQTVQQLDAAFRHGSCGVAVFNYRTLFGPGAAGAPPPDQLRRKVTTWMLTSRPPR